MSDNWSDEETPARAPSPPRGGGGGGGGNRACFKCNEEGHMSRECPNNPGGGGGGNRACFKCNEEGHMSRDCPQAGGGGGGSGCRKCGQEGHFARDCTEEGTGGGGGCRKCGEEGHFARDCPQGGGGGPKTCRKCGQEGHMQRECPDATDEEKARGNACYNCGEEGHRSSDCTNEAKPRTRVNEAGEEVPTERYVPPEMLEGDAIFAERKEVFEGSGINFQKYDKIEFKVTGEDIQPSVETFEQLTLRPLILENLRKCGYKNPTPIQKHGSPQLMVGRHVMCCAQTGSGKTAAFLVPIINVLLNQQETLTPAMTVPAKPEAVILAPTRELAIQIGKEANMYSAGSIIKVCVVYGGTAIFAQKKLLMRGANILVATVGRLKQFITEGHVDLSGVQFFILDEADRMLDMGFMPDVTAIVEKLPPKNERVSGMFSATFPREIQDAAKTFLENYIYIVIGVVGGACTDVTQEIIQVEKSEKRGKIMDIIKDAGKDTKILVFCASKKGADFLATFLCTKNVSCTSIHGDRLQSQRETALREFTVGTRQVLVATAVAARGLDIPKVGLVVNYDLPSEIEEYVHRIGRTGRVGHTGKAISFYDDGQDSGLAASLVNILSGAGQTVPDFLGSGGANGFQEGEFASEDTRGNAAPAAAEEDDW